ncbi:MAG TPA: hypothetical protein VHJ17_14525 [Thermomonospora sp.]|nr:hypothetical protein [Thermomonospora sp.]
MEPYTDDDPTAGVAYPTAKAVMDAHGREIIRLYRAEGAGITGLPRERNTAPEGHDFVIVVHVRDAGRLPGGPRSHEGVPLMFRVSGVFRAEAGLRPRPPRTPSAEGGAGGS